MTPKDRTSHIKAWLSKKIEAAELQSELDFANLHNINSISSILTDLIETNTKGFRGVVATALAGLETMENYNPLNSFYTCNPRSIFEQAIWYVFTDKGIPCGLSDPLNVAKNVSSLDAAWVLGKRPEASARAVVAFLTAVMNAVDQEQRQLLEDYFYFKLVTYSRKIASIPIEQIPSGAPSRQELAKKLIDFSMNAPESGATPQLIIAAILRSIFVDGRSTVCGGNESVFGTNTTSKKPADIWLEINSSPVLLFEITLKKVDFKRIDDCIVASNTLGTSGIPLTFICRVPQDISSLAISEELSIYYKNRTIDFVDYGQFIKTSFSLISEIDAIEVFRQVRAFVGLPTTSIKTKDVWNNFLA